MKKLKFIHITKCAGTAIERIGLKKKVYWGMFHKEYGWWHEFFPNKSEELKSKYDWFVVVRNPYERLISEFYYRHSGTKIKGNIDDIDEEQFNLCIKNKVLKHDTNYGGHYSEQYKYIDKNAVIHIIKFENIEVEFNELMKKYNLDIVLNETHNRCKHKKKFSVKSFTPELIKLINEVYDKDFTTFGYDKITLND